jgi:hypothetical protein
MTYIHTNAYAHTQIRKELELAIKNKQSLLTWKVAKTQQLTELEARVKRYEKWSHIDVDKLRMELEKKENELKTLQVSIDLLVCVCVCV